MQFKLVFKNTVLIFVLAVFLLISSCKAQPKGANKKIIEGAQQTSLYLPLLQQKKVGIVANQTSVIYTPQGHTHLVDSLLRYSIQIKKVFSPEHGFRGTANAAEHVANETDTTTGLPIISLYGKNKKPTPKDLENIDIMVFDIQDVGVRFYTYISTLHYVMEACAENHIPLVVLDRPNPNGHYVDGPMLNPSFSSFVGKHPVPLVYGMTIGEYAQMILGERWLNHNVVCDLTIIPLQNYTHQQNYSLAIPPSPNLPNNQAINLYPSLGFFEGTPINAGRGTKHPFQRYGSAHFPKTNFSYTPIPNFGSKHPKDQSKICYGVDLKHTQQLNKVNAKWLVDAYQKYPDKNAFFGATFTIHAGDTILEHQLKNGYTAKQIEQSWQKQIANFKKTRAKYLLYP